MPVNGPLPLDPGVRMNEPLAIPAPAAVRHDQFIAANLVEKRCRASAFGRETTASQAGSLQPEKRGASSSMRRIIA